MSSLIKIGIKDKNGKYQNYIVSIQDEVDNYGNNVSMYVEQTKEERMAKAKRKYVGNGRVIWTSDNKISVAPFQGPSETPKEVITEVEQKSTVLEDLKSPDHTPESYAEANNETEDDLPF